MELRFCTGQHVVKMPEYVGMYLDMVLILLLIVKTILVQHLSIMPPDVIENRVVRYFNLRQISTVSLMEDLHLSKRLSLVATTTRVESFAKIKRLMSTGKIKMKIQHCTKQYFRVACYADPNDPYKPYVCDDDYTLMVKELLQRGASANIQDNSGDTALHISATYEMDYIAKQLLHYNADVNIRNNSGKTAIEIAEKNEYEHVRNLLKDNERKSSSKC